MHASADLIPDAFSVHLVPQEPARYTTSAHDVWREALERNRATMDRYGKWVHPDYLEGLRALDLPRHVPRIEEINERLRPTSWRTVCVDGYIPTAAYVGLMSMRVFPVSRSIRRAEHIDYAPAPDLIHDILGHLPMLFSAEHRDFLRRLATVMAKASPNRLDHEIYAANLHMSELKSDPSSSPVEVADSEARVRRVHGLLQANASELTQLTRMYLWSIEFGLLGRRDDFSIYGAALFSSPAELRAICDGAATITPYGLDVIERDIAFSDLQNQYFVARDFAELDRVLQAYERRMADAARTSQVRHIVADAGSRRRSHA